MDAATNHSITLISIVVGLGLTALLGNLYKLIRERQRVVWDATIAALWAGVASGGGSILGLRLEGDDPASEVYVRNKRKACEKVGMESWLHQLPATTSQAELLALFVER